MLLQLIDDMNRALDNDCYFSALSLSLTFPDICAKAMFKAKQPTMKNRDRYIQWYDEYVGKYEKCPGTEHMPYLSGEVVYSLRCSMLHQGTPNIDGDKMNDGACKIDSFALLIESKKQPGIYVDSSVVSYGNSLNKDNVCSRSYEVNVRRLCLILSESAKHYYEKNKEQFDFFNCSIVDLDQRYASFKALKERLQSHNTGQ